jgi:hypothetical protein
MRNFATNIFLDIQKDSSKNEKIVRSQFNSFGNRFRFLRFMPTWLRLPLQV